MGITVGPGEAAALTTAVSWAFSALFFAAAARRVGAARVNLLRLALATALLSLLVIALGAAGPLPAAQAGLLALSGVVGLSLGDAAYFRALEILGPRRAALTMALAPVFAAILMVPLLDETLGAVGIAGMVLTIGGVAWVQAEPDGGSEVTGHLGRGLLLGVLGALGQAGGYVLAKAGLGAARSGSALAALAGLAPRAAAEGDSLSGVAVFPLYGTLVRMAAATAWALAGAAIPRQGVHMRAALGDRRALGFIAGGTLTGPVFGVWLSLVALAHSNTAVASTLLATSPLFVIPLVRVVHGRRASARAWIGALVAIAGVALLSMR